MRTLYSFSATRFGEPEFYLRPFLGSPRFWGSFFGMTTLLAFSLVIALKSWKHLSVGLLGWMAFSIFLTLWSFRQVWITHERLRMIIAVARVDPMDKESPLGDILGVIAQDSNKVLYFNCLSLFARLVAVFYILSGR
jgi:hypothetical protein